jgi:hypothetical protein
MVTVAPGMIAPVGSVTVPLTLPELVCAKTGERKREREQTDRKRKTARRKDECMNTAS